ncbi:MAG: glycosyltransferase family 4 protein [Nitrospirae bacterium]|nr:glycosyltransferase family 4 protein [Nitrospirota bacterium]MBF0536472.1 glycosyltransferase family 4 protein [Nitrospirota bacterium]MBF0618454.1 glycosyltransferase family 4 protein [Nitrospirota bacterium]
MRILHTEWSDDLGGQEKRVLAEAIGMQNRGHHVVIACREHAKLLPEAQKCGIECITLPFSSSFDIVTMIKLYRYIKAMKFDIVNTHSGKDSWVGGIAARLAGVPALVRTRHINIPLKRNLLNFIHYLPQSFITCGDTMRENLVKNCGFPENKVVSIPTGVEERFFNVVRTPELKKSLFNLPTDSIVISNVGVLRGVKGHEVTLNAVKRVVTEIPQAVFLFAGDGPKKNSLLKLSSELGITKHVVFAGYIKDVTTVFAISNVSVLSSHSEGIPQSILQSMAAGVPVAATGVGGVPEVIEDEKTGLLIPPNDHDALSAAIIRLINNPALYNSLISNAKEFVLKNHSIEVMLDKTESLYSALMCNTL